MTLGWWSVDAFDVVVVDAVADDDDCAAVGNEGDTDDNDEHFVGLVRTPMQSCETAEHD